MRQSKPLFVIVDFENGFLLRTVEMGLMLLFDSSFWNVYENYLNADVIYISGFDVGDLSEEGPDDLEGLDAAASHVANLLSTEPADSKFLPV